MTHDELLAEIDQWLTHSEIAKGQPNKAINVLKALRAVVELHKPEYGDFPDEDITCDHCGRLNSAEMVPYPCKTIQAIERKLG